MAVAGSLPPVIPDISMQDFQVREQDSLRSLSKVIDTSFEHKAKIKLVALGYDEDELDEVTHEVLYEGVEIYENSDDQSQDILELNALEEVHSGLLDRAVLIVFLRKDLPCTKVASDLEDESVCELYPDMRKAPEKNPTLTVQVPTYADMRVAVQEFITTKARQAKKIVLVFHDEEMSNTKGKSPQVGVDLLYKGSKEIMELHSTSQESGSVQLPQAMDIILVEQNIIDVISEDSNGPIKATVKPSHPFAVNMFEVEQLNGDMQKALHLEDEDHSTKLTNMNTETWISIVGQPMAMET